MDNLQNMIATLSAVITVFGLYEVHILFKKNEFSDANLLSRIVAGFNLMLCLIYFMTIGNI